MSRLRAEFDVEFEWMGCELFPEDMAWPDSPARAIDSNRPKNPSRLDLAYAAEGMEPPTAARPPKMRSHNAHEAVEHAKRSGVADELATRLYSALWDQGRNIDDPDVIAELAEGIVADVPEMMEAIRTKRYRGDILAFDEPAYAKGVYYVPTYWIGEERYAEQPYSVVRAGVAAVTESRLSFYSALDLPVPPEDRPYVLIDMVATIDGKTVSGKPDEGVLDLGSKVDHEAMHRLERQVDAVMIGAQTLRSSPRSWKPRSTGRVVVSRSGELPWDAAFLSEGAEKCFVVRPSDAGFPVPAGVTPIEAGLETTDLAQALAKLREVGGIRSLLVEGGSVLNAELLKLDLVDELFLTIAPKVKLGRTTPTYADGDPLPREDMRKFRLIEEHRIGDEMFLRYGRT